MAGTPTTNYKLPTYAATDAPDLTGSYNSAMVTIDELMKKNENAASAAQTTANTATSTANTAKTTATNNASSLSALQTRVNALETGGFAPSSSDKAVTVAQLAGAKITSNGIIYYTA